MSRSDARVLGTIAVYEQQGVLVDRRTIADEADMDADTVWHCLQRLIADGAVQDDPESEHTGRGPPKRYYSLTERAANALVTVLERG